MTKISRRRFTRLSLAALAGGMAERPFPVSEKPAGGTLGRIPKVDTHMHLFGLDQLDYPWLNNAPEIHRTYLPQDFKAATRRCRVEKIVFMESGAAEGSSLREIDWVLSLASHDPRIKGIVARAKLLPGGRIDPTPEQLLASGWVRGVRASLNAELLSSTDFTEAMALLARHQLSFDLLLQPQLIRTAAKAVAKAPDTVFILDHLGNPDIKGGAFEGWKKDLAELAKRPNVNLKISGIITRAGAGWTTDRLRSYVHYAIEQFGFDRIVYGGDWPVVLRAGSYRSWSRAFERLTREFSREDRERMYYRNAERIYRI